MASKVVREPPPAPITSPRLPSNSTTRPATPRWSWASICAPLISKSVGGRAWRASSRPLPSSSREAGWGARASPPQSRYNGGQAHQLAAADAQRGDHLLHLELGEREESGEVGPGDMLRVLLRHLLDVDATHVAEDHDRQLGEGIVGDSGEVLPGDGRFRLHEDAARPLAADLEAQDGGGPPAGGR